jgi:IS4 transposase
MGLVAWIATKKEKKKYLCNRSIKEDKTNKETIIKSDLDGKIVFDQIVRFKSNRARKDYPNNLRCIKYKSNLLLRCNKIKTNIKRRKEDEDGTMVFITNNFTLKAADIVKLYKERWNIECFFKWIKQNLEIKHFYSNDKNGVKIQIWTAIISYLCGKGFATPSPPVYSKTTKLLSNRLI